MSAPTPSAPTPGPISAPTPGVWAESAPTPGASGGYGRGSAFPNTPGAWGGDDDDAPRYAPPSP
jgi:transcription elongation factor SPT5